MLFAVCYGIGAAAFLALIALSLVNRRPRGIGLGIILACIATALWAVAAAVQSWWMPGLAHALEDLRSGAWLLLLATILATARKSEGGATWFWLPAAAVFVGVTGVAVDGRFLLSAAGPTDFATWQVLCRILLSITGILLVENLFRNTSPGRRWNVIPLCIALGAMFAYDLYVFCDAVVLREASPTLLAGRGILLALIVPLLVLTMVRNPGWNIDIHVSRGVVFHGATLIGAGVFLLLAAAVAGLVGQFPGQWASISEIFLFCGSVILVLVVLSTGSFRSRLRRLITENFFSTHYDYRAEWLRTIATLSSGSSYEPLTVRAIRAVADVVDSPGGSLWLEDAAGNYRVAQVLAMNLDTSAVEAASGEFVACFRGGEAIIDFAADDAPSPSWAGRAWVAVPLPKIERLIGFVILAPSRAPCKLDWESLDLLLAIGQQVAAYLEEERATRELVDSQALIDYSKRFSFVIHDIKNVSGQLSLMIPNFRKFGEHAEFRADMIRGLEGAANKLRGLIDRLRPDAPTMEAVQFVNVGAIVADVVRELNRHDAPVRAEVTAHVRRVCIPPANLHAVLTHLVTNAQEASTRGDEVVVSLHANDGKISVDVTDKGCGMSAEFIRNSLFVPFISTKPRGHGVGSYQARALVRAVGGDVEVISAVGRGTTVRIILPEAGEATEPPLEALAS